MAINNPNPGQSVNATTAKESAFRIQQPNSLPRSVKAIFLDQHIAPGFKAIRESDWSNLKLYTLDDPEALTLLDSDGQSEDLARFASTATIIILLTSECRRAELMARLGEGFNRNNRLPTLFILDNGDADAAHMKAILKAARPHVSMLVNTADETYLQTMFTALRA